MVNFEIYQLRVSGKRISREKGAGLDSTQVPKAATETY